MAPKAYYPRKSTIKEATENIESSKRIVENINRLLAQKKALQAKKE